MKWINRILIGIGGITSALIFIINLPILKFAMQSVYNQMMGLEVERLNEKGSVVFFDEVGQFKGRIQ